MTKTNITDEEKVLLQAYAKTASLVLICFKPQAVLMAHNGLLPEGIADVVGRTEG